MSGAEAGAIALETTTVAELGNNRLKTLITITNTGGEPACRLRCTIDAFGSKKTGRTVAMLEPGATGRFDFDTPAAPDLPGRYPLAVTVLYEDEAGYPLSAVSGATVIHQDDPGNSLAITATPPGLADTAELTFNISNIDNTDRNLQATLLLPREIGCADPARSIRLSGGQRARVSFSLFNIAALTGATYPVFGYFQYDHGRYHHTAVVTVPVSITENIPIFRRLYPIWLAAAGALAALLLWRLSRHRGG